MQNILVVAMGWSLSTIDKQFDSVCHLVNNEGYIYKYMVQSLITLILGSWAKALELSRETRLPVAVN